MVRQDLGEAATRCLQLVAPVLTIEVSVEVKLQKNKIFSLDRT
jgi:hypothetical protein